MPVLNPADAAPAVVAAFDFDGTLTRRDTLLPFLVGGLGWPRFAWVMLRCGPWLAGYALRLLPNHVAKARLLSLAFAGRTAAEVDRWTTRWLADLPGQLRPDALQHLQDHQRAGHCCVLVSASPDAYLRRAAQQLGFEALICTELARAGDTYTGAMQTPNCYGPQKSERLLAWLAAHPVFNDQAVTLHAYGDSPGDVPLLCLADHAWYRGRPWVAGQSPLP